MVSPVSAPSQTSPPLSYADRAKKGGTKIHNTQNVPRVQRMHSQSASVASTTTSASSAPSASTSVTTVVSSTEASTGSPPATISEHPSSLTKPHFAANPGFAGKDQIDVKPVHDAYDSSTTDPTLVRAHQSGPSPAVNVWNVRKEQLAQTRASSQPKSIPPSPITRSIGPNHTRPSQSSTSSIATGQASSSTAISNTVNPIAPEKPNGHAVEDVHQDPFVVRPHLAQSSQPQASLAIDDADDWPTVGTSVPVPSPSLPHRSPLHGSNGILEGKEKEGEKNDDGSVAPMRKSEKTKWVPIPPEELQAAADAHRRNHPRQTHSRSRSQYQNNSRSQLSTSASASASASGSASSQNSQGQSRTNSSAGMRQSVSNIGSVSHSRNQSRTGSVHSSPRQPSVLGGGRRLPEEGSALRPDVANSANRNMRPSRDISPQAQGRLLQKPRAKDVVSAPGTTHTSATASLDQADPQVNQSPRLYPAIPPSLGTNTSHSHQSTHASNSPATNPSSLPISGPSMYAVAAAVPPGYIGSPPYQIYAPYGYSYVQQYMQHIPTQNPMNTYPVLNPSLSPILSQSYPGNTKLPQEAVGGVPPTTSIIRPPPPGQSDAVAGYRDVGFVLPTPATYASSSSEERGRRPRELSFGSIDQAATQNKTPSPVPATVDACGTLGLDIGTNNSINQKVAREAENGLEKLFTTFSIGITPDEPGPSRLRSRTRTHSKSGASSRKRNDTAPARLGEETETLQQKEGEALVEGADEPPSAATETTEKAIIVLTDSETTWAFGTASQPEEKKSVEPNAPLSSSMNDVPEEPTLLAAPAAKVAPIIPSPTYAPPQLPKPTQPPRMSLAPLTTMSVNGVATSSRSTASTTARHPPPSALSPLSALGGHNEFEVKNFGWGFGRANVAPPVVPDEQLLRNDREFQRDYPARQRRPSYGPGGYGQDRGANHERGGYSGRRGRGFSGRGGYGRGRGGYQQNQAQNRTPYTVNQPIPMPPPNDPSGYYAAIQQPQHGTTYFHPAGYETAYAYSPYSAPPPIPALPPAAPPQQAPVQAPVPTPMSTVSFPLDHTRYYLLGQLEYYLSAQNLAQDFYLRQRMDSRGWIYIPLIASFNRVRQLTMDLQLVKDMLTLSSLLEVRDDYVRVRQWDRYVLPNAPKSNVDQESVDQSLNLHEEEAHVGADLSAGSSTSHGEEEDEEDEEEDEVEFVLGKDANRSWTPERNSG